MSRKTVKCPHCAKDAALSRNNRIMPHITPGQQKCLGEGLHVDACKMIDEARRSQAGRKVSI